MGRGVSSDLFDSTGDPQDKGDAAPIEIPEGNKEPISTYVTEETAAALDVAWAKLRRMARNRSQVTKSAIVELALIAALRDLEEHGADSLLGQALTR